MIMKDKCPQLPAKSAGLSPLVKERLAATLAKLVPQWQAEPALDYKRVTRPTGPHSCSTTTESYQGTQSWGAFRQKVAETEIIQSLEKLLHEQQPELLGYVMTDHGQNGRKIQDCFSLCMILSKEIVRRIGSSSLKEAVTGVVSDLDNLLITEIAECQVFTALNGLKLPDEVDRIDLDEGLYIRALTNEEIAELGSYDIASSIFLYDFSPLSVTTALISKRPSLIKLSLNNKEHIPVSASHQLYRAQISNVLEALHILKSGCVGRVVSSITVHPTILPNMNGTSSAPIAVNPCRVMQLSQEDIDKFVLLYKALVATQRNEVKIAAARLLDAESRLSPVDALLDAVIGLEALLNNDRAEISFRVALNYGFLGPIADRRKRFDDIREVYKIRSSVVHGGLNKDASRLYKHAQLAKECLRDALTRFLTDESLMGNKKLDGDFWLDRVLPPI